jgi:predicted RNA-binding Zn-ribbon protein involved in translation (DUF1610 family)
MKKYESKVEVDCDSCNQSFTVCFDCKEQIYFCPFCGEEVVSICDADPDEYDEESDEE